MLKPDGRQVEEYVTLQDIIGLWDEVRRYNCTTTHTILGDMPVHAHQYSQLNSTIYGVTGTH